MFNNFPKKVMQTEHVVHESHVKCTGM